MRRSSIGMVMLMLLAPLGAFALTGSGESGTVALETVSPTLDSVSAVSESGLSATFSESMRTPGVTTPGNYAVSDLGAGTLHANPDGVTGGGPYALSWSAGEMQDGASVTVTATGLQDALGNPINPAQNTASCAGIGVAPVFTNLIAIPSQASVGNTVTIAFTCSEPLVGDPAVTINGHDATWVSGAKAVDFTFSYVVQAGDPLGMASVSVTGFDLANNLGSLSSDTALEIVEEEAGLPLYAWPGGVALLAAGVAVLALRRKSSFEGGLRGMLLFLMAVSLCCSALAQAPMISNIAVTQNPTATSTQVDVYYDLVAPNGPCAIMLSLSKNGGADGYTHPITHYAGDIANVTTGTGKHIVWDIRADYPEEDIPNARIRLLADDGIVQHTLTYTAGANGSISGASPQIVNHGQSGEEVTAVPATGFHFVRWSDARTDNPRTDTNVTADITVTAEFAINTYTIACNVSSGNGTCTANPATVNHGGTSLIMAAPATGWHLVAMMDSVDGVWPGELGVSYVTTPVMANRTVTAAFAIDAFTLTYTAGANGSISGPSPQPVNYGASGLAVEAVPNTGYRFVQWSDARTDNPRTDTNVTADLSVTAVFAKNSGALRFDGANDFARILNAVGTPSGNNPYTIEVWAKGDAWGSANQHLVAVSDTASYHRCASVAYHGSAWYGGGHPVGMYVVHYGGPTTADWYAGVTVEQEAWYHFAATYDGTTERFYVNGRLRATGGYNTFNVDSSPIIIGSIAWDGLPSDPFDGIIDEVRIWNRARGAAEILGDYDKALTGSESGLVAYYDFEEGAGQIIHDKTANHNDGGLGTTASVDANDPQWVVSSVPATVRTLRYLAGVGGTIVGKSAQDVFDGEDGEAVTATPNSGYVFSQWSDGVLTATRMDTNVTADINVTASFVSVAPPVMASFAINNNAATVMNDLSLSATLNSTATNGPTDYMASESASFTGAMWQPYSTAPSFTLSFGVGTRTVYFKVRNGGGESGVMNDTIFVVPNTVSVAAGSFDMGRTSAGDDATYGGSDELPVHSVTLGAYQLGKYEVTNKEYCDVLNWALAQGYLYADAAGTPWAGSGNIYAGGTATSRYLAVNVVSPYCNIQYSGGVFIPKTRVGLPGSTNYSMDTHPVVMVSWYGAVAFCNWLSQRQGLTPCYDMNTALWPLTVAPPTPGGYRLPTEAEWERAAAWDEAKHWIYSFISDTLAGKNRANDTYDESPSFVNPLGLTTIPYTSPIAWFNGANVSPNGPVTTVNSPSPAGAYDMSGNVWEWCHDWYLSTYYTSGGPPWSNPTGPATGSGRVDRGGSWGSYFYSCRSADRGYFAPTGTDSNTGFRLARS